METNSKYRIFKATLKDEIRLQEFYSGKSRSGDIVINPERKPNFFAALPVEGYDSAVYAVEDTSTGQIVGAAVRSFRKCFINGSVKTIGYLGSLRVDANYRKTRVLYMIFCKLREIYSEDKIMGYLASVFGDNFNALGVLTSRKAGISEFRKMGEFFTCVFKHSIKNVPNHSDFFVRTATTDDIPLLLDFMNKEGAKYQFSPYYDIDNFGPDGSLRNLKAEDIVIAFKDSEIAGCLALWNQTPFREWKVESYSKRIKFIRPIINIIFRMVRLPLLPMEKSSFNYRFLSLVYIRNNDVSVFRLLLNKLFQKVNQKEIIISATFHKSHPLLKALPQFKIVFRSFIFMSFWNETKPEIELIDNRLPYIEGGSL